MVYGIRGSSPDSIQIDLVSGGLERLVLYRIPELLSSQCVYRSMEGTEMAGSRTRLEQDVRNRGPLGFQIPEHHVHHDSVTCLDIGMDIVRRLLSAQGQKRLMFDSSTGSSIP